MDGKNTLHSFDTLYELQFSTGKFITYCSHLVKELNLGDDFFEKGFRGMGYIMLMRTHFHLDLSFTCNIDLVIDTLIYLLKNDFFHQSFQDYSNAYKIFIELTSFSEKDYSTIKKEIQEKGKELYHSTGEKYRILRENSRKSIDVSIRCFFDFEELLIKLVDFSGSPYIGNSQIELHPSVSTYAKNFGTLLKRFEQWELERFDESLASGIYQGERFSDIEIIAWYEDIRKQNIQLQVLRFGVYLLKIGEFDTLPQRENTVRYLTLLAKKISKEYILDIEGYVNASPFFTYEDDEVDKNIQMYTEEIILHIYDGDLDDIRRSLSQLLDLLEEENIEVPEEIVEEKDLAKKVHELFYYLLIGNYFLYEDFKTSVVEVLLSYYETRNPERERNVIEFVSNKDLVTDILGKEIETPNNIGATSETTPVLLLPHPNIFLPKKVSADNFPLKQNWFTYIHSLTKLLEVLTFSQKDIYIRDVILHPKYQYFENQLNDFIDMYHRFQDTYYDQSYRAGELNFYFEIKSELTLFYDTLLREDDILKKSYIFGCYLLRSGEFDSLEERHHIQSYLLNIGNRFANGIQDDVGNYIFPDEEEEFSIEIEGHVLNILDSLMNNNTTEDKFLISYIENFFMFLEDSGVEIPNELYKDNDTLGTLYQLLSFVLLSDFIQNKKYKIDVAQLCIKFYEERNPEREKIILDYIRG